MVNHYIETSLGTIGIYLTSNHELQNYEHLTKIFSKFYSFKEEKPFEILENEEGLFLIINLKDDSYGRPEYKIRKRFTAQILDIEPFENNKNLKNNKNRNEWTYWCSIL